MTQLEPHRLANNQRSLLEILPDPVLVVDAAGRVEYMNRHARAAVPELLDSPGKKNLQRQLQLLLGELGEGGKNCGSRLSVKSQAFDCHLAPFAGYRGDDLYWLVLQPMKRVELQVGGGGSAQVFGGGGLAQVVGDGGLAQVAEKPLARQRPMVGRSAEMQRLKEYAEQVAQTDANVLITGESGTGKELVAELIRHSGPRRDKAFLTIHCAAISDDLLESDLFGHEKGSFTGAHIRKIGKFEAVEGGTLFLDEVGEISPRMQAALLRVLQHGEIIRVGGNSPTQVDVRIIAATGRDLYQDVQEGRFRLDLYYRLNIFHITVPPLRSRPGDIIDLAEYFVAQFNALHGRRVVFHPEPVRARLEAYGWPGNVRELENVIQRAVLTTTTGEIGAKDLHFDQQNMVQETGFTEAMVGCLGGRPLRGVVDQVEREVILQSLAKCGGNVVKTAEELAISKAALYEKMRRYEISAKSLR